MRRPWEAVKRVARKIRPPVRIRLAFAAVVLLAFLLTAGFTWQVHETRKLATQAKDAAREGQEAHDSICVLKADLSGRITDAQKAVDTAEAFLAAHPDGAFGFTADEIQASVATSRLSLTNQRSTFGALAKTKCDPPTPQPLPATAPDQNNIPAG